MIIGPAGEWNPELGLSYEMENSGCPVGRGCGPFLT